MSAFASSTELVQNGGIPSQVTRAQVSLTGDDAPPTPSERTHPVRAVASVPLVQSRGLPLHPPIISNPRNWPVGRGVPNYIPYEKNIDVTDRPLGQNGGEFGFLVFMLSGVQIVAAANSMWRSSVGLFTDKVFKYKIGGHW